MHRYIPILPDFSDQIELEQFSPQTVNQFFNEGTKLPIQERLLRLKEGIQQAAEKASRNPDEIRLVAVSKTKPVEAVRETAKMGHLIYGENRIQQALEKIEALEDLPLLEWHLVGHLQKNKARFCPGKFQWLHSLDSLELAQRLDRFCLEREVSLNVLVQLNLSKEDSKSGLKGWDQLQSLAEEVMKLKRLHLRGLMTMPAPDQGEEQTRHVFAKLRELQLCLKQNLEAPEIDQLSMGMTADYGWGILEGAPLIRIGSAIFGPRY